MFQTRVGRSPEGTSPVSARILIRRSRCKHHETRCRSLPSDRGINATGRTKANRDDVGVVVRSSRSVENLPNPNTKLRTCLGPAIGTHATVQSKALRLIRALQTVDSSWPTALRLGGRQPHNASFETDPSSAKSDSALCTSRTTELLASNLGTLLLLPRRTVLHCRYTNR